MGLYADKESSKSGCHFLFIIYTNAISHETTIQGMTTFLLIGPSSADEELEFESLSSAILKNVPCDTADLVEKHIYT